MRVTVSTGAAWRILALRFKSNGMPGQSPLKAKPLRVPGQSVDEAIDRSINNTAASYFLAAAVLFVLAAMESVGYLTRSPRHPVLFPVMAVIGLAAATWRSVYVSSQSDGLRQRY